MISFSSLRELKNVFSVAHPLRYPLHHLSIKVIINGITNPKFMQVPILDTSQSRDQLFPKLFNFVYLFILKM